VSLGTDGERARISLGDRVAVMYGLKLEYCSGLVREPARSIVVLITDFYEGRSDEDLVRVVRRLVDANMRMVGLGALGYDAQPQYNRHTAGRLRKEGMDILVCTPEKLAEAMGKIITG
jgi:hypothetical protein